MKYLYFFFPNETKMFYKKRAFKKNCCTNIVIIQILFLVGFFGVKKVIILYFTCLLTFTRNSNKTSIKIGPSPIFFYCKMHFAPYTTTCGLFSALIIEFYKHFPQIYCQFWIASIQQDWLLKVNKNITLWPNQLQLQKSAKAAS